MDIRIREPHSFEFELRGSDILQVGKGSSSNEIVDKVGDRGFGIVNLPTSKVSFFRESDVIEQQGLTQAELVDHWAYWPK
jgi:hypothetical protein